MYCYMLCKTHYTMLYCTTMYYSILKCAVLIMLYYSKVPYTAP